MSCSLRRRNGGIIKITPLDIEEGVKGKSQQLEKSLRPLLPSSCFHIWNPNDKGDIRPFLIG